MPYSNPNSNDSPSDPPERESERHTDYVEITPPKGFVVPEGEEDEFEQVDTWRKKPDGTICLVKLGDTPMPQLDEDEKLESSAKHQPPPSMDSYVSGLGEAQPGA